MNTIATILMAVSALVPSGGVKRKVCPPIAADDSVIIRFLPPQDRKVKPTDGDYVLDEGFMQTPNSAVSADERYAALKAALDEKFNYMFELKAALERAQSEMSAKWNEYYALQEKYNRELKKIIGAWATETSYEIQK